ncbi:MAG: CPBP family intramembrane metalloprotease [Planctomycetota bacterium]|nr:MAG: CPBP family intramembrane metalloprotease [Planctomycetota bacterium]
MKASEIIKQFGCDIPVSDFILFSAGIVLFAIWLVKTSLGKTALTNSIPRRNNMPNYMPFIPLFIWFGVFSLATTIIKLLWPKLPDWQSAFFDNLFLCISALIGIAVIVVVVKTHFARRLKGLGLNIKTIHKDLCAALVNLVSVWPLLIAIITLTTFLGKFIWRQNFQFQQHKELELIAAHPQLPLRVLIAITTIAIVPVFEEMLFRGLFQTMIRSVLLKPYPIGIESRSRTESDLARTSNEAWLAIAISSGLFALIHSNADHWPALFVLSVCMGYAYEKSGSLFRPIFIHSLFNASSVIAVLSQ